MLPLLQIPPSAMTPPQSSFDATIFPNNDASSFSDHHLHNVASSYQQSFAIRTSRPQRLNNSFGSALYPQRQEYHLRRKTPNGTSMPVTMDHLHPSRMVLHLQNIYSSLARQLLQRFLSPARQYTTLASTLISTLTIHPQLATKGLTTICTPAPGPPLGLTQAMPHRTMAPFLATIMPFIKLKRSLIHMVNPKRLDSQTLTSQ
jgi:hypothetical protein